MARSIELKALCNVRDLGGTPGAAGKAIRTGLLFRGDQPYPATERLKGFTADMVERLGAQLTCRGSAARRRGML